MLTRQISETYLVTAWFNSNLTLILVGKPYLDHQQQACELSGVLSMLLNSNKPVLEQRAAKISLPERHYIPFTGALPHLFAIIYYLHRNQYYGPVLSWANGRKSHDPLQ